MGLPSKIKEYLDTVCHQIRYRTIHEEISKEIEDHIIDQRDAYKTRGLDDDEATVQALKQMGDPVVVGMELDRTHRPKPEWSMIILTIALLLSGIILRFYTSPQVFDGIEYYNKQLIFTVVGIAIMVFIYFVDFTILGKYPKLIFLALIIITALLAAFKVGRYSYTVSLLLLFPTAFSGIVYSMRNKGFGGVILCEAFFVVALIISGIAYSSAGTFVILISCLAILTAAILKNWFGAKKFYSFLLIYLPVIALVALRLSMVWGRLRVALFPSLDPLGAGYVGNTVRQLLSGSSFTGQGMLPPNTHALSVNQILPSINNDLLLTYSIHRFGWIVFIGVVLLLTAFIARAFMICLKQRNVLAVLVSLSVVINFAMQIVLYLSANLGVMLFAPLTLPFISQSNSFLLINMCLAGILLSVFRTGRFMKDRAYHSKKAAKPFIRFEEGKLIIDFRAR